MSNIADHPSAGAIAVPADSEHATVALPPPLRLACLLGAGVVSWAIVISPLLLIF